MLHERSKFGCCESSPRRHIPVEPAAILTQRKAETYLFQGTGTVKLLNRSHSRLLRVSIYRRGYIEPGAAAYHNL